MPDNVFIYMALGQPSNLLLIDYQGADPVVAADMTQFHDIRQEK
jgi:hypothetical protein